MKAVLHHVSVHEADSNSLHENKKLEVSIEEVMLPNAVEWKASDMCCNCIESWGQISCSGSP